MSGFTLLVIAVAVALFAALAGSLAWAQQHARVPRLAPLKTFRRRRRPF
jgi:hypothetical protein